MKGALPIAIQARREGFSGLIVPASKMQDEAAMVNNLDVYAVEHIK
jgi:magnesium chelatase family protein